MLLIVSFTEVHMSNLSIFIYEVESWPILVLIRSPGREIIIERNWVGDSCFFHSREDILIFLLIGKLWRVDSYDYKASILILLIESLDIGCRRLTVRASECPEVDEYYLPSKRCEGKWR